MEPPPATKRASLTGGLGRLASLPECMISEVMSRLSAHSLARLMCSSTRFAGKTTPGLVHQAVFAATRAHGEGALLRRGASVTASLAGLEKQVVAVRGFIRDIAGAGDASRGAGGGTGAAVAARGGAVVAYERAKGRAPGEVQEKPE